MSYAMEVTDPDAADDHLPSVEVIETRLAQLAKRRRENHAELDETSDALSTIRAAALLEDIPAELSDRRDVLMDREKRLRAEAREIDRTIRALQNNRSRARVRERDDADRAAREVLAKLRELGGNRIHAARRAFIDAAVVYAATAAAADALPASIAARPARLEKTLIDERDLPDRVAAMLKVFQQEVARA
jgi:hypothetical protein